MKKIKINLMKKLVLIIVFYAIYGTTLFGQRKIINLPDLPGYVTLKCDFHLHTMFSDGDVWPIVRIDEALRDGLDAIAFTDHLEYIPHKEFVPADYNAAWNIGERYARERNLILVHGAEITRKMPPGHFNALFIKDATLLAKDSVWDCFDEAIRQGAFLQWNHPGWKAQEADGIPKMYDIHKKMIEKGWIHGIEYFNYDEYYPLVFTFCEQNNIALMGNSDIHGVISETYTRPEYSNRPMTLVFAKEKTPESLKEAMFAGRTMVYFQDKLVGKEEYAMPFFYQCVSVAKPFYKDDKKIYFEVSNNSDIPFYLINGVQDAPSSITLEANSVTRITVSKKVTAPLVYDVKNVITGETRVLKIELKY